MTYSAFEIIGPAMVGPSSSHTAGACRIGWLAQKLLKGNEKFVNIRGESIGGGSIKICQIDPFEVDIDGTLGT